jgi:hypothetical protein
MFLRVEIFNIESISKRGFEEGDMHVVIIVESMTIVSSITCSKHELVPMFFHMDSIIKFKNSLQNWSFFTIVIIIVDVKGTWNNKGEKQLLIANVKREFGHDVFVSDNNLIPKYKQHFETYNGRQCVLVLI